MSGLQYSNKFTRLDRLLTAHQFSRVFKDPYKSSDRAFTLLVAENEEGRARLGVIVAKKQVRQAVARHRIKRVVRESFRTHKNILNAYDIVVICKQSCSTLTNNKLKILLNVHWKKLGEHAAKSTD